MEKTYLTPGKLYASMGEEFRRTRSPECSSCQVPMVYMIEQQPGDLANWLVEPVPRPCDECERLIRDIVRSHSSSFDIFDPTATLVRRSPGRRFDWH